MTKRRSKTKTLINGRSNAPTSRFARLDHRMLSSNAYRALSPNARSLLVELTMIENGENNGSLFMSVRDAAHRLGVNCLTAASNAFDELQAMGFIAMTQAGHFRGGTSATSKARCWRLTWLSGPGRKTATSDYLTQEPEPKTTARKRMENGQKALKAYRKQRDENKIPVLDSLTLDPFGAEMPPIPVLESDTGSTEVCAFPAKIIVRDSDTHTAVTRGNAAQPSSQWWSNDRMTSAGAWAAVITSFWHEEAKAA